QLIECDVTEQRVSGSIIGNGDVARDAVVLWRGAVSDGPVLSSIGGVGDAGIHLPGHHQLLRVTRIDGNGRLIEETWLWRDITQVWFGRSRQRLGPQLSSKKEDGKESDQHDRATL